MPAVLVFVRDGHTHRRDLTGAAFVIGRGPDCDLRIADERVSTRHCRFELMGSDWTLQDLGSTNRTFVNNELVSSARWLRHGDYIRLGAHDAILLEAMFEHTGGALHTPLPMPAVAHPQVAELEAQLAATAAELAKVTAAYQALQAQAHKLEADAHAAARMRVMLTNEIEGLRQEAVAARSEQVQASEKAKAALQVRGDLEAERDAAIRKGKRELDDAARERKELESRLSLALSDLATARTAHTNAEANAKSLKTALDEAISKLNRR
jgi:pSer/pThr/pTyr-binding forkhead associated (FHA) protein